MRCEQSDFRTPNCFVLSFLLDTHGTDIQVFHFADATQKRRSQTNSGA